MVLYVSESWIWMKEEKRRLIDFGGRCLSRIRAPREEKRKNGIRWMQRVTKEEVRIKTGQRKSSELAEEKRLTWAGHVWSMGEDQTFRTAERWMPERRRPRGRPKRNGKMGLRKLLTSEESKILRMEAQNWKF